MCGRQELSPDPLSSVAGSSTFTPVPVKSGTYPDQQAVQSATTTSDAMKALRPQQSPPIAIS
jgi:hypothetical protein